MVFKYLCGLPCFRHRCGIYLMKGEKQCGMCESLQVLRETKYYTAVVNLGYHAILISNTSGFVSFCGDLNGDCNGNLYKFIPA